MTCKKYIALLLIVIMCVAITSCSRVPTISVAEVKAKPGETVYVDVSVRDNPGILGAVLELKYDSKLTLVNAEKGSVFNELTLTKPGQFTSPCDFVWDGMDKCAEEDGTILTLAFEVSHEVETGEELFVCCSCKENEIVDSALNGIDVTFLDGKIIVK